MEEEKESKWDYKEYDPTEKYQELSELTSLLKSKHIIIENDCKKYHITGENIHTALSIDFAIKCIEANIPLRFLKQKLEQLTQ